MRVAASHRQKRHDGTYLQRGRVGVRLRPSTAAGLLRSVDSLREAAAPGLTHADRQSPVATGRHRPGSAVAMLCVKCFLSRPPACIGVRFRPMTRSALHTGPAHRVSKSVRDLSRQKVVMRSGTVRESCRRGTASYRSGMGATVHRLLVALLVVVSLASANAQIPFGAAFRQRFTTTNARSIVRKLRGCLQELQTSPLRVCRHSMHLGPSLPACVLGCQFRRALCLPVRSVGILSDAPGSGRGVHVQQRVSIRMQNLGECPIVYGLLFGQAVRCPQVRPWYGRGHV